MHITQNAALASANAGAYELTTVHAFITPCSGVSQVGRPWLPC